LAFLIRRHQKWARRLGPMVRVARFSFIHKTRIAKASARPFWPRHLSLSAPLHENTTLSSVANAPGPNFSPPRCLPRGLGHATLDSDHAECIVLYHGRPANTLHWTNEADHRAPNYGQHTAFWHMALDR